METDLRSRSILLIDSDQSDGPRDCLLQGFGSATALTGADTFIRIGGSHSWAMGFADREIPPE
jgi:hypothetical protein